MPHYFLEGQWSNLQNGSGSTHKGRRGYTRFSTQCKGAGTTRQSDITCHHPAHAYPESHARYAGDWKRVRPYRAITMRAAHFISIFVENGIYTQFITDVEKRGAGLEKVGGGMEKRRWRHRLEILCTRDHWQETIARAYQSMTFLSYIKMHFSYLKSNVLRRWLNILSNYVQSRTFFTPKIHPPQTTRPHPPTWPATLPGPPPDRPATQPAQPSHPARHPTLPATPPCLPAFPDSLARLVSHYGVASVATR